MLKIFALFAARQVCIFFNGIRNQPFGINISHKFERVDYFPRIAGILARRLLNMHDDGRSDSVKPTEKI
jgi:hypothetical protein